MHEIAHIVVRRPGHHGVVGGIWLNEAFATFMEVMCQDAFRPQWKVWVSFGAERDMALQIDGLHATRPIEFEVVSPDDTQGMFGRLTYEKGAGVLRMLEQYLGAETTATEFVILGQAQLRQHRPPTLGRHRRGPVHRPRRHEHVDLQGGTRSSR